MKKSLSDTITRIGEHLPTRDLLEGLAEEASELSQAALKVIRASGINENVTPVTESEAYNKLVEEVTDVMLYLATLGLYAPRETMYNKAVRWLSRLDYKKESEDELEDEDFDFELYNM